MRIAKNKIKRKKFKLRDKKYE